MQSFNLGPDGKPMSDQEYEDAKRRMLSQGSPQNIGQGMSAVAQALMYRSKKNPFPSAPGGWTPAKALTGLFSLGGKGGLY